MLILQGERDYQVTMEDFGLWRKALGPRKNVIFKTYPGLNHLFIHGKGKCTPSEYLTPGHVSATVIDDIVTWIEKLPVTVHRNDDPEIKRSRHPDN